MAWCRILDKHHIFKPKLLLHPSNRKLFRMSRYFFVPIFKPDSIKCKSMTLPSLATAPNTITVVGFLVSNTGGMSEGLYTITLEFLQFTSASTNTRIFPAPRCLMNNRSFGHLLALIVLALAVRK
ncbi:Hypothetical predicted protein [Octopus vulgaris]|uniref:Uncharacterized protein n=1 Tax=Octopus vulgaris TaxID=6645 RepID=A0AA36AUH6_OCTVU|nr:Hypothetical predicted protein [Octopus vulgaris]